MSTPTGHIKSLRRGLVRVAALLVVVVLPWSATPDNHLRASFAPDPLPGLAAEFPPPHPVPGDCALDPADLPPAPPGPDGRPPSYLHTCGSRLYDSSGREVRIVGVNWSGMELPARAPHGLLARNYEDVLDQVAALGFNTIRLPFSSEGLDSRQPAEIDYGLNPDLKGLSGVELLDRLIAAARARGLKVILDRHRLNSGWLTPLWYSEQVPEERWIADWRMLAARYRGDDTVVGVDLHNEPHGDATWGDGNPRTDWRLAAEKAGNAVLEANPYLLILVEGVEHHGKDEGWWWGGELQGARTAPVRLSVPNRLVYSPHDYGPSVYDQSWLRDSRFPANLPALWDKHWGYIAEEGIAPVVVGEFGGRSVGADREGEWHRALLGYLRERGLGAIAWSLDWNPETGGIIGPDWQTVDVAKQQAYVQSLAPSPSLRLRFRQGQGAGQPDDVAFAFQVVDDGPEPVPLTHLEVRYWLRTGAAQPQPLVFVDSPDVNVASVRADLVSGPSGPASSYVRVRFETGSPTLGRYGASGTIVVRLRKPGSAALGQSEDYSYAGAPELRARLGEWDRITLYQDGKLVWGQEPITGPALR